MKVTLKEIAELLGMKNTAAESGLNSFAIGQEVIIRTSANNDQGAYCSGGAATSLTAAVKKARAKFGKGWRIKIWLEDECVKSFVTRQ